MKSIYPFNPDFEKTREAIVFFSDELDEITYYYILKMMYFAERAHLEKYGRLIFGNEIGAKKYPYGPVPEQAYQMVVDSSAGIETSFFTDTSTNIVTPTRRADETVFSQSDVECLRTCLPLAELTFPQLRDLSHDEAYEASDSHMTIETFTLGMENRESILEDLKDPFL